MANNEKPVEIWRGAQWSVNDRGDIDEIEDGSNSTPYWIDGSALAMDLETGGGWPTHMAYKTWVDVEEFCQAFKRACAAADIALPNMEEMFARARAIKRSVS